MCPCQANNINNVIDANSIIIPSLTQNCTTELSFLRYLVNLINLNIGNSNITNDDRFQLQIYKGQVESGINIANYCYVNYQTVETNIFNVISKYN